MPTDHTPLAESLMTTMAGLRRRVRRRVVAQAGLEPALRGAQIELLRVVENAPGVGVAAAARKLHLAGNSVSTLVNQLVEAGMLDRRIDPADRRAARLELTEAAHTRLATWRRTRTEYVAGKLDQLSEVDRSAIAAALPAIGRLVTAIEEDE
ncbi:MarR family winged helix-turn-helix transcriptional regulator [Amycolatopsis alkalitolerans]|uniref:MarR family transcriptional regulator n=1 Tax=Amycolatopsis alkalitolerans TaxID=2547244 RepID=A0A5C4LVC1_9PSEU|nr:MarR family transcriptional regulator [Amycolatopsis alkalitolerans]TNC23344.1 MarR family transcriptional regulator [Amycolatopsis alkalitolerans]